MYLSKQYRHTYLLAALAIIFGLVSVLPTQSVFAQDRALNKAVIEISLSDGVCHYQLFEMSGNTKGDVLADQDSLIVKPNARIALMATGTDAKVFFQNHNGADPDTLLAGARAVDADTSRAVNEITSGSSSIVKVRKQKSISGESRNTKHRVQIWCNTDTGDIPANSMASFHSTDPGTPDFLGEAGRGPSASTEWIPAVRVYKGKRLALGDGGPGMEVEDP